MNPADTNLSLAIKALGNHDIALAIRYIQVARKYLRVEV